MAKKREIRNSTAEFLTFVAEGKENGIQVLYKDETIWATQKAMATLFDVGVPAINKHLKNIFDSGELMVDSVISKMETTVSKMEKCTKQLFIVLMPSSAWVIVSTPSVLHNSANGALQEDAKQNALCRTRTYCRGADC